MPKLSLQVQAPAPNTVLHPGDLVHVAGIATGIGGAEQVGIDAVTIALAGAPIEASVTQVPKQKVPTYRFEADLTVPAVGGSQQLGVVAVADNNVDQLEVDVPVVIQSPVTPPPPPPWQTSQLAAPGAVAAGARIASIAKPLGCELWWLGADGAVTGVWSEPGSAWASYQLAAPGSAVPSGGVSAISKGADAMEVWWIAPDGSVQAAYHDGGWAPYALTGPGVASTTGGITSVFKGGDSMEVWWIAPDGSVQGAYHDGGWAPYALTGPGVASTTGGITSVFKGGDSMEVWWVTPDGSVTGAFHESDWQTYTLAGPGSASTTCRITSTYGAALGGKLMRVWWTDAAGTTYQAFFDVAWVVAPIGTGADPSGTTVGQLFNTETATAFWARTDGSVVDAFPPEITLSAHVQGGRGLRGNVWLTLRADGSSRWQGDVTNDEVYGYNYALSVFAATGTSLDIGAAHHGSVAGWGEPGSSDDLWDEWHDPNAALAGGLAAYRFSMLALRLEHSVDVVDYIKDALNAIFEVAVGAIMVKVGVVLVGITEVVSYLDTGSFGPGVIAAGGVPWLSGPAGIFLRLLLTAAHDDGRQLTDEEYAWANDMVFRGALPSIDSFRITNYLGLGGDPFTFPTFGGPTLVSVGEGMYNDIHTGEPTMIHELTHVSQIASSEDVVFTARAMVTQLLDKTSIEDAYSYGPPGFDYTDVGLEAQAKIVEDWFVGSNTNGQTATARDAQSPYYHYITDDVRIGRF